MAGHIFVNVWYAINHFFRDRPILTYIQRYIHRVTTLQAGWYFDFDKKTVILHTKRWQIVGQMGRKSGSQIFAQFDKRFGERSIVLRLSVLNGTFVATNEGWLGGWVGVHS